MQLFRMLKAITYRDSGVTLVETIIALAVLGTIAIIFLSGLVINSKAAYTADEQATASSLARSQMEWVQHTEYKLYARDYSPDSLPGGKDYINYSVTIAARALHDPDDGIQKITVTVTRSGKEVTKLEGYKVNR